MRAVPIISAMTRRGLLFFQWFAWISWLLIFTLFVWVILPTIVQTPLWVQIALNPAAAILSWLLGYKWLVGPLFCGFAIRNE